MPRGRPKKTVNMSELVQMGRDTLLKEVTKLLHRVEVRQSQLRKAYNYPTQAQEALETRGGLAGRKELKGMTRQQLLREAKKQKQFLEAKTSTVAGERRYRQNVNAYVREHYGTQMEGTAFWALVAEYENKIKNGVGVGLVQKYEVAEHVAEWIEEGRMPETAAEAWKAIREGDEDYESWYDFEDEEW